MARPRSKKTTEQGKMLVWPLVFQVLIISAI
jgi:hypothetical protein